MEEVPDGPEQGRRGRWVHGLRLARRGRPQSGQQREQGGLPGAVRPQQAEERSTLDAEAQVIECYSPPVGKRDVFGNHGMGGGRRRRLCRSHGTSIIGRVSGERKRWKGAASAL